jgi:beta-phosphoglucomutase-like phosphatase (HAD superfamily)
MTATVLLCDADGNLFPSEEPAFVASADVTNELLRSLGVQHRYSAEELRAMSTGKNFRTTAVSLAAAHGVDPGTLSDADLERWVAQEQRVVTAHLLDVLRPDAEVIDVLTRLSNRFRLAVVSSSALPRVNACLRATGLDGLFPYEDRFSAEDSLPTPSGKPDPAVYLHALAALGLPASQAVAVEDSVAGVSSATGAGIVTIGNLVFTPGPEREQRAQDLRGLGATAVVASWPEVEHVLVSATAAASG